MSRRRADHRDHAVVPLEVANERKRKELESSLLPPLRAAKEEMTAFRRLKLDAHARRFECVRRDGEARLEDLNRATKERFARECAAVDAPVKGLRSSLRRVNESIKSLKAKAQDPMLNRLLDSSEDLDSEVRRAATLKNATPALKDAASAALCKSVKDSDALQIFSPWLPGWDIRVGGNLCYLVGVAKGQGWFRSSWGGVGFGSKDKL